MRPWYRHVYPKDEERTLKFVVKTDVQMHGEWDTFYLPCGKASVRENGTVTMEFFDRVQEELRTRLVMITEGDGRMLYTKQQPRDERTPEDLLAYGLSLLPKNFLEVCDY